jgi:predicted secreted protein
MSLSFSIAIYFIVWWLVLFAVLPFGVRTQDEAGSTVAGTPGSAPIAPRLLRTVAITTLVSTVVFAVIYLVIVRKWIALDDIPILRG